MKHLINRIEIPVENMERAIGFYSKILGVTLTEMDMARNSYALFPAGDSHNTGALVKGKHYKPSSDGVVIYLDGGDDLNTILLKVKSAGGNIVLEKIFLSPE